MKRDYSDTIISTQIFALGLVIIAGTVWTTISVLSQITTSF